MLRGPGRAFPSICQRQSLWNGRTPMKNYVAVLMVLLMASTVYSRERRHLVSKTASLHPKQSSMKALSATDGTSSSTDSDDNEMESDDDADTDETTSTDTDDKDSSDIENDSDNEADDMDDDTNSTTQKSAQKTAALLKLTKAQTRL